MAEYSTDEERIEAIKAWWSEYGKQTMLGLVLVLSGYLGWQYVDHRQVQNAHLASEQFSEILDLWPDQLGDDTDGSTREKIVRAAEKLQKTNTGSAYAWLSSMALARVAIDKGDLDGARAELSRLLDMDLPEVDEQLVRLRLARVESARGDADGALRLLQGVSAGALEPLYKEAIGDFLFDKGNAPAAYTAYKAALQSNQSGDNMLNGLLEIKIKQVTAEATRELPEKPATEEVESESDKL